MDEETRKALSNIADALERFWLESRAAFEILESSGVSNAYDLIDAYCEKEENKALARERFALARALIESAQKESKALEELTQALQKYEKPN